VGRVLVGHGSSRGGGPSKGVFLGAGVGPGGSTDLRSRGTKLAVTEMTRPRVVNATRVDGAIGTTGRK